MKPAYKVGTLVRIRPDSTAAVVFKDKLHSVGKILKYTRLGSDNTSLYRVDFDGWMCDIFPEDLLLAKPYKITAIRKEARSEE